MFLHSTRHTHLYLHLLSISSFFASSNFIISYICIWLLGGGNASFVVMRPSHWLVRASQGPILMMCLCFAVICLKSIICQTSATDLMNVFWYCFRYSLSGRYGSTYVAWWTEWSYPSKIVFSWHQSPIFLLESCMLQFLTLCKIAHILSPDLHQIHQYSRNLNLWK